MKAIVNKLRKYVRIFGAPAPKTGLYASIFFAAGGKKGFPLQSLVRVPTAKPRKKNYHKAEDWQGRRRAKSRK
ncbi:MAG: hypothetical protein LBK13_12870 [Spirochaetales bacterium]|jgi:hypothetical protein|nr:hypothetical protein [Spirochaetales bacterium]